MDSISSSTPSYTNSRGETFQVGDWVLHDYEIGQLTAVRQYDHGITVDVSTGVICSGTNLDRVWQLTLWRKTVAESVERYARKLRDLPGGCDLNWPDIHRLLSQYAEIGYKICGLVDYRTRDQVTKKEGELIREESERRVWKPLEVFYDGVKTQLADRREVQLDGVLIFR